MHVAARNNMARALQRCMELGADPNDRGNCRMVSKTALHVSIEAGALDAALVLLKGGADLFGHNKYGQVSLGFDYTYGYPDAINPKAPLIVNTVSRLLEVTPVDPAFAASCRAPMLPEVQAVVRSAIARQQRRWSAARVAWIAALAGTEN